MISSESGSLTQTASFVCSPPATLVLSIWKIAATCSRGIISLSHAFLTLVSELLERLMSSGASIFTVDLCYLAVAECKTAVQYHNTGSAIGGRKGNDFFSV